jgi:cytochrome c biogenesis factor
VIAELGLAALWLTTALAGLQLMTGGQNAGRALASAVAAVAAVSLLILVTVFVQTDLSVQTVPQFSHPLRTFWQKTADAITNPNGALLVTGSSLAMAGAVLAWFGGRLDPKTVSRALAFQAAFAAPVLILTLWRNPFERQAAAAARVMNLDWRDIAGYCFSPALSVGLALLGTALSISLAAQVTGERRSARNPILRLWVLAALIFLTLGTCAQLTLDGSDRSIWAERKLTAIDGVALVAWLTAVTLAYRLDVLSVRRRPANRIAALLLLAGMAVAAIAVVQVRSGTRPSLPGRQYCQTGSAMIGPWSLQRGTVQVVAGPDFTALQANVSARIGRGPAQPLAPQDRRALAGGPRSGAAAGQARITRWNGELLSRLRTSGDSLACNQPRFWWLPLANWLQYGAVLIVFAAMLAMAVQLASLSRRNRAVPMIAYRQERRRALAGRSR